MKKVAIIYARFGPYHMARLRGAQSVFSREGYDVFGLEVCPDDKLYAWNKVEESQDVRRVRLFPSAAYADLSRRRIMRAVSDALDHERPEIVACPGWYFAESIAGAIWCSRHGAKSVLMSESGRLDHQRVWWREWVKQRRVRHFDAALVGGRVHADYLVELGMPGHRIALGHNVVDNDHFSSGAAAARADDAVQRQMRGLPERYLMASGRFIEKKNFARLLHAYKLYREKCMGQAWSLVLCGDGPLKPELQALAVSLNIAQYVQWPGFVQYEELPTYYGLSEAFILPSVIEPWGLVVNEAMASGLPVLASTRVGCHADLVEPGGNGFVFDPYQVDDIANCMVQCVALPAVKRQAMGQRSQELIEHLGPIRFGQGLREALDMLESNESVAR